MTEDGRWRSRANTTSLSWVPAMRGCARRWRRARGARVLVLEAAPFDERGGNSRYTAGALRFVYNGVDDLLKLCDLSEQELATSDFGTYTQDKYYDDPGNPVVDALEGHPLRADVFAPGLQARGEIRVLGRPRAGGLGRRSRSCRGSVHRIGEERDRRG